jgi:hypothetical protein
VSLVALLLACAAGPTDAEAYAVALRAEDLASGLRACADIDADHARGDCQDAVMDRHDSLDAAACDEVAAGMWRDECQFQLAERIWLSGDVARAIELCSRGRFARACTWHLLQDEAQASVAEPSATAQLRLPPYARNRAVPDAARQFWITRFRARASADIQLDEAECTTLSDPMSCNDAVADYQRQVLDALRKADLARVCSAPTGQRATIKSGPSWVLGPLTQGVEDAWAAQWCGG